MNDYRCSGTVHCNPLVAVDIFRADHGICDSFSSFSEGKQQTTLLMSLPLSDARNHGGFPSCEAMVYRKKGTLKRCREIADQNELITNEV